MTQHSNWKQLKQIFTKALELKGEARDHYLKEVCKGDREILADVRSLLEAYERPGVLDQKFDTIRMSAISLAKHERMKGKKIGNYKIIRELGYGGMGSVYLAERADGEFDQRAALKLLHSPFASNQQLQRFKSERQILASLEHDHIARLMDGGITDQGQPYYVMEFVDGQPIDEYCDHHQLSVNQRLELFLDVCSAVQYAHRKLVVHRDLKPSNIFVTGNGSVKLLDFGIAKMLRDNDGFEEAASLTRQGLLPLTPSYASPEQIRGEVITTSSDIYQLGVILYELLSGCRPYKVEGKSPADIEKTICNTEPQGLGKRFLTGSLSQNPNCSETEQICNSRSTDPGKLEKKLQGDVDTIVMKALRKEPDRRYESAEQFADDIRRYLRREPVTAHPDSRLYRAKKFIQRNVFETTAATLVLLLLAGYVITITWHSYRTQAALEQARMEADKSEQVVNFMMRMFEANDPYENLGDTVTAGVLLDQGVEHAEKLDGQPAVQAQMFDVVGRVYRELGKYDQAFSMLSRALNIREENSKSSEIEIADNYYNLGTVMHHRGSYRESDQYFEKAIGIYEKYPDHESLEYANSLYSMANIRSVRQDYDTAESMHRKALQMRQSLLDENDPAVGESFQAIGNALYRKEKPADALEYLQNAMEIYRTNYNKQHPVMADLNVNIAHALEDQNEFEQAESYLIDALEIRREVFGENHTETGLSKKALADYYRSREDFSSAESIYLDLLKMIRNEFSENHPLLRPVVQALGRLYLQSNRPELAEPHLRETVHLLESILQEDHPRILSARNDLGTCLFQLRQFEDAESLLLSNLKMLSDVDSDLQNQLKKKTIESVVELYEMWGRNDQAEVFTTQLIQLQSDR